MMHVIMFRKNYYSIIFVNQNSVAVHLYTHPCVNYIQQTSLSITLCISLYVNIITDLLKH